MFTATDLLDQLFPDCYCSCQRCYYQLDFLLVLIFAVLTWFQEQLKEDESAFPAVSDRRMVVYEPNQRKLIKPNLKLNLEDSDDEDVKDEDEENDEYEDEEDEEEEDRNNNSLSTLCADAMAADSDLSELVDYNLSANCRVSGSSSQIWDESGNVSSENSKEVKEIGTQTEPDLSAVNGDICLTFKELKQMRRAVSKLELLTNSRFKAKEDRAKICYNCSKTKFKLFGPWSTKCKLCKKLMCTNCLEYAKVSTRRHNKIPLQLSPVDNDNRVKIAKRYELMSKSVQALNTQRVDDGSLEDLSSKSKLKRSSSINWFKSSPSSEGKEDNCFTKMKLCKDCQTFLINCLTQQS